MLLDTPERPVIKSLKRSGRRWQEIDTGFHSCVMISLQGGRNSSGQLRRFTSLIATRYETVARKDTVGRSEVIQMRAVRYGITLLTLSSALSAAICHTVLAYDPTFHPPVDYPVGNQPGSICGADLDGDSDNDLVVINQGDTSVSVLINNGDGTFQPAVYYAAGGSPRDMVAADFIGDSQIDLAVASQFPNVISILVGNGDGTFLDTVYHVTDIPDEPLALCTGDFDDDGDNDLSVVAGAWTETPFVCAYINNFAGYDFWENSITYEDYSPYDIVSADFNGDDWDDLVVLEYHNTNVYIYLSGGMFGWFSYWWDMFDNRASDQISCADVNGDSAVDIVGAVYGGGYEIFLGNGYGFFGAGSYIDCSGNTDRLYVADLDDDGDPDIALTGTSIDSVFVAVNDGSGSFSSPSAYYAGGDGDFIIAIELNGDNDTDLVVSHAGLNTISVLISGQVSGVGDSDYATLPETLELSCNYPNPFNPQTTITFSLERDEWAAVSVFELTGRRVALLTDRTFDAGTHSLTWSGRDEAGRSMPSGTYIVRLETESNVQARKVMLLR